MILLKGVTCGIYKILGRNEDQIQIIKDIKSSAIDLFIVGDCKAME